MTSTTLRPSTAAAAVLALAVVLLAVLAPVNAGVAAPPPAARPWIWDSVTTTTAARVSRSTPTTTSTSTTVAHATPTAAPPEPAHLAGRSAEPALAAPVVAAAAAAVMGAAAGAWGDVQVPTYMAPLGDRAVLLGHATAGAGGVALVALSSAAVTLGAVVHRRVRRRADGGLPLAVSPPSL
ncbi:hypothetical protein H9P43_004878 [Blastocladiella emersonii ATCC 22665]|nr:hypothetical protein H9P43_004878 [Blastocladiella emersonii ATCC 22665]